MFAYRLLGSLNNVDVFKGWEKFDICLLFTLNILYYLSHFRRGGGGGEWVADGFLVSVSGLDAEL